MRAVVAELFVEFLLGFVVPDALDARDFEGGGAAGEEAVRRNVGEILVDEAVGGDDGLVRNHRAFGDGGTVADPDIADQVNRLGERRHFSVLVQIPGIVETAVDDLDVPRHADIVSNGDLVEAEDLEVGATVSAASAERQCGMVSHQQVGTEGELHRATEHQSAVNRPDGALHRRGDVRRLLADDNHLSARRLLEYNLALSATQGETAVNEDGQPYCLFPRQQTEVHQQRLDNVGTEKTKDQKEIRHGEMKR